MAGLRNPAHDSYLPALETRIPALAKAWDNTPVDKLAEQIKVLRAWEFRWGLDSVATSLAVFYGEETRRNPAEPMLEALAVAAEKLTADFGGLEDTVGRYQPV
jgi:acyl-homoserine-lactone acylase